MKKLKIDLTHGGGVLLYDTYNNKIKSTDICGTILTNSDFGQGGVFGVLEPKCILAGTLNGGKWKNMHEIARRYYSDSGIAPTIHTVGGGGNLEPKTMTNYRVRKLTPKECWRLMGFDDEDFDKAGQVNSNSQLYKQAGNSIVVNVLEEIFNQIL